MNFRERKERLEYLFEMVEKGRCYKVATIANQLNCSKSTIERMIKQLRKNGVNIRYCKILKRHKIINR
ncbi:hypothetical protein FLAV_01190 [Flavobacteriales bacterium]|jgi:predicted transcriptional regulator|nr:hypothetical protein FLAV_01190 [Flavobacteriales bacterium]